MLERANCFDLCSTLTHSHPHQMKKNAIRRAKVHIRVIPPDAHTLTDLAAKSNRSVQQVGRIAVSAGLVGKKLDLEALSTYGGTWGNK